MKKILKYFGFIILVLIGLFLFVANFSSIKSNFQCSGKITYQETTESKTIYIILEEYRWWVGLWGDSDGNMKLEIPNEDFDYFDSILENGNLLSIFKTSYNPNPEKKLVGNFSTLSKTLDLDTSFGVFSGSCNIIN